jgi:hypothetical protein
MNFLHSGRQSVSDELPHVMATKHPRAKRWKEREAIIKSVLGRKSQLEDMAKELGYKREQWI